MESSGFVYSHEKDNGLGAMMIANPLLELQKPDLQTGGDSTGGNTKPKGTIIHRPKPLISIARPPVPAISVQPKQPVKKEEPKKEATSQPVDQNENMQPVSQASSGGFNFKEFYQENKKMVLIGGGIGGSLLLLMLLK